MCPAFLIVKCNRELNAGDVVRAHVLKEKEALETTLKALSVQQEQQEEGEGRKGREGGGRGGEGEREGGGREGERKVPWTKDNY